jgi:hypothetical protein
LATLRSLIVRIGADTADIEKALSSVGESAKSVAAGLSKLGNTPLGKQTQQDAERLLTSIKGLTDQQQKLADRSALAARGIEAIGGPARLTKQQLDEMNRTVQNGLDAFRALGQEAPKELHKVAAAIQQQQKALSAAALPKTGGLLGDPTKIFENIGAQIGATAAGFVSAQAIIGTVTGVARAGFQALTTTVVESVKAYGEAEGAQSKLIAALRSQGQAVPAVINQYNALATQFQQTTVFSDDLINQMQALLVQVGDVMPASMDAALKASTDLAAGLGIDLQSATLLVAKAAAGHTETLGRYGITVDEAELKSKGFSAVLDAINKQFGGQAAAQVETYAGRIEQMANSLNNVQEAIGKFIVNNPLVIKGTRDLAEALSGVDANANRADHTLSDLLGSASRLAEATDGLFILGGAGTTAKGLGFLANLAQDAEDAADAENKLLGAMKQVEAQAAKLAQKPARLEDPGGLAVDAAFRQAAKDTREVEKSRLAAAVAKQRAELEKFTAVMVKAGEASKGFGKTLDTIDGTVVEGIKFYRELGFSVEEVARLYGVSETQVKAVDTEVAVNAKVTQLAATANDNLAASLAKLGIVDNKTIADLKRRNDALEDTAALLLRLRTLQSGAHVGEINLGALRDSGARLDVETIGQLKEQFGDVNTEADKFDKVLREVSRSLQQVSKLGSGTFAAILNGISAAISGVGSATAAINKAQAAMTKAGHVTAASFGLASLGVFELFTTSVSLIEAWTAAQDAADRLEVSRRIVQHLGVDFENARNFSDGLGQSIEEVVHQLERLERQAGRTRTGPATGTAVPRSSQVPAGSNEALAQALKVNDIIRELGGLSHLTAEQLKTVQARTADLFTLIARGGPLGVQAIGALDDVLSDMGTSATTSGGLVSRFFLDMIAKAKAAGVELAKVNAFIGQQVKENVIGGLSAFTESGRAARDTVEEANKGKAAIAPERNDLLARQARGGLGVSDSARLAELNKQFAELEAKAKSAAGVLAGTAVKSEGAANALAASTLAAFTQQLQAGRPVLELVKEFEPIVEELGRKFDAAGLTGGSAFEELRAQVALAKDELAGPLLQSITGLGSVLTGLHNSGLLTQDIFSGLTDQVTSTFNSLVGQGKSGAQALRLLQPTLQKIFELQKDFGFAVDDTTQALLDQATAEGIVGEKFKSAQQQMIDGLNKVVSRLGDLLVGLGIDVTDAANDAADGVNNALAKLPKTIDIPVNFLPGDQVGFLPGDDGRGPITPVSFPQGFATGGVVTAERIQRFATGGHVMAFRPRGTDTVPAMLTPGEAVLTRATTSRIGVDAVRALNTGGATVQYLADGGVVDAIPFDHMTETARQAAATINAALSTFDVHVNVLPTAGGFVAGADERRPVTPFQFAGLSSAGIVSDAAIQRFAQGGHVLAFTPRGTDTVPAMLTPGEAVLTRAATDRIGIDAVRALNAGGATVLTSDVERLGLSTGGFVTAAGVQHFAFGGRVLPFLSSGAGAVPATLSASDVVLTPSQQQALSGFLRGDDGSTKPEPTPIYIQVQLGDELIAEHVIDGISRGGRVYGKASTVVRQMAAQGKKAS